MGCSWTSCSWMVTSQAWIPGELSQQAKTCLSNSLVRIHITGVIVRTSALSSPKASVNVVTNAHIGECELNSHQPSLLTVQYQS